jgi:hypothetical protein
MTSAFAADIPCKRTVVPRARQAGKTEGVSALPAVAVGEPTLKSIFSFGGQDDESVPSGMLTARSSGQRDGYHSVGMLGSAAIYIY